jgi:hypothetical protein
MTRTEFQDLINHQVEQAIADGMSAVGTDEFIEESILTELENHDAILPESTRELLCSLLIAFGMRRREFLAGHPAH